MRLWSVHPKYLDTQGLIALWRESLLAKKVLQNKTKGYKKHPQLLRFKEHSSPINAIANYLKYIWEEAKKRNFNFDSKKIGKIKPITQIKVSKGQVDYEFEHLLKKLRIRNKDKYTILKNIKKIEANSLFKLCPGKIEKWEKI